MRPWSSRPCESPAPVLNDGFQNLGRICLVRKAAPDGTCLVAWKDDIRCYREEQNLGREQLAQLESGTLLVGTRRLGLPWEDLTPREIKRLNRSISELESLMIGYNR